MPHLLEEGLLQVVDLLPLALVQLAAERVQVEAQGADLEAQLLACRRPVRQGMCQSTGRASPAAGRFVLWMRSAQTLLWCSLKGCSSKQAQQQAHQYFFWMKGSREVSMRFSDSLMRFLVRPSSFLAYRQADRPGSVSVAHTQTGAQPAAAA